MVVKSQNMKNIQNSWLLFLLLLVVVSCKKSNTQDTPTDTTVPAINLVDPTPGKTVLLGAALHLQMELSDNVALKSYKVEISKSLKGLETADWAFTQTWTIPAAPKTFSVNHNEITVPLTVTGKQTTTGNYDLTVTCFDTSNNQTSKTLTIVLSK